MDKALISIGYSKWGKGQLERELAENVWLTVPADEHILFDVPYELRYAAAFEKLGVNPNAFGFRSRPCLMHQKARFLAFDFGEARIGVAQGDAELGMTHPLATVTGQQ